MDYDESILFRHDEAPKCNMSLSQAIMTLRFRSSLIPQSQFLPASPPNHHPHPHHHPHHHHPHPHHTTTTTTTTTTKAVGFTVGGTKTETPGFLNCDRIDGITMASSVTWNEGLFEKKLSIFRFLFWKLLGPRTRLGFPEASRGSLQNTKNEITLRSLIMTPWRASGPAMEFIWKCWMSADNGPHWNKNVILTQFSSLVAMEFVILTTSNTTNNGNFVKKLIFSFTHGASSERKAMMTFDWGLSTWCISNRLTV